MDSSSEKEALSTFHAPKTRKRTRVEKTAPVASLRQHSWRRVRGEGGGPPGARVFRSALLTWQPALRTSAHFLVSLSVKWGQLSASLQGCCENYMR